MKTSVTLNNGTILEVGKNYFNESWIKGKFIEIIAIDGCYVWAKDNNGERGSWKFTPENRLLPYTAPQEEVKWKTFLIEFDAIGKDAMWRPATKEIVMMKSIDDARNFYPEAISITEVDIDIKEK
jgi:hypothetical protein